MDLERHIEGVLFYEAEPMTIKALAGFFERTPEEILSAIESLSQRLLNGATRIVRTDTTVELVTAPEVAETIEKLRRDDLKRDIGKAGAETLAIILYKGQLSRAEIDNIRGVNSSFILRNLLVRGLIERRPHPRDQRSFMYAITSSLLEHLGITKREELPQFADIMNALDTFEKERNDTPEQVSLTD